MARPIGPSSRVYVAFGMAAVIGLAVFTIWWMTAPKGPATRAEAPVPPTSALVPSNSGPPGSAPVEAGLPRGGALAGSTDAPDEALARLTHATLVRINRSTDRVEPCLAESWTVSADNLVYIFKLRPGIRWSDGTPLTADDLVTSLAAVQVSGTPLAARVLDPQTIEVTFAAPFAPGLRILDGHPILPRHKPVDTVGLGPFVAPAVKKGPGLRTIHKLVRNPHYWRNGPDGLPLPYIDELTLGEGSPGQQDFADSAIRPDDYEELKKLEQNNKARLFELGPGLDADALWFLPAVASAKVGDLDRPWLTSETFRLAISAAVDRREYCKQVFFGACDPILLPVTPANVAWFNPDLPLGRANPQVAREMLAGLGLRDRSGDGILEDATRRPVRFSLLIRRDVPSSARAAVFLKDTLRVVGVEVEVTPLDANALRARRLKGNYDAIYDRIRFRDTDPAMSLDFWLSSGEAHVWMTHEAFDWERRIDQLMLKNAATFDRVERLQAFVEVQRIYGQHMPALFFGAPHVRLFTSTRVLNATPSPLRPHLLWNAENLAALK
ncbi:MAG TPA: ABC transporter substrate-binding protein [Vicinamibacterales bacterium]|nr:ABC transporter substrate-binding protein [Vicinamibacterales bacterium]